MTLVPMYVRLPPDLHEQVTQSAAKNRRSLNNELLCLIERGLLSQKRATARERATRIPDDFTVTAEMVAWCRREYPGVDGRRETQKFIAYWQASASSNARKRNWEQAWRTWIAGAAERQQARPSRKSRTEQAAELAEKYRRQGR